jgi:hypothetical protein
MRCALTAALAAIAIALVQTACGEVAGTPDAEPPPPDAPPSIDATGPADICNGVDDDQDGQVDETWGNHYAVLDFTDRLGEWSRKVGAVAAGQPKVVDGALYIDDAGIALSETSPTVSWIYDLDGDEGTQVTHDAAIGVADFSLTVDVEVRSSEPQLTLAGIALTGDNDRIAFMLGGYDPSLRVGTTAGLRAWVRDGTVDRNDPYRDFATGPAVRATVRAERRGRTVTFDMPGTDWPPWEQTVEDSIARVALVSVRDKIGADPALPFGNFTVRSLALCWGRGGAPQAAASSP